MEKSSGGRRNHHSAREAAGTIRNDLQHVGEVARDAAQEQMEHLRERGLQKVRQLEDRIVDQPLKSLAIAVGIGFLFGFIWKRF